MNNSDKYIPGIYISEFKEEMYEKLPIEAVMPNNRYSDKKQSLLRTVF